MNPMVLETGERRPFTPTRISRWTHLGRTTPAGAKTLAISPRSGIARKVQDKVRNKNVPSRVKSSKATIGSSEA